MSQSMSPDQTARDFDESTDIHYLNTDLEIYSAQDLSPLVPAFGEAVSVMYQGEFGEGHLASFEIATEAFWNSKDPDAVINGLCELVEALPEAETKLWLGSHKKVFNMGFNCGEKPCPFEAGIRPETLARAAALGAGLTIMIYP